MNVGTFRLTATASGQVYLVALVDELREARRINNGKFAAGPLDVW